MPNSVSGFNSVSGLIPTLGHYRTPGYNNNCPVMHTLIYAYVRLSIRQTVPPLFHSFLLALSAAHTHAHTHFRLKGFSSQAARSNRYHTVIHECAYFGAFFSVSQHSFSAPAQNKQSYYARTSAHMHMFVCEFCCCCCSSVCACVPFFGPILATRRI